MKDDQIQRMRFNRLRHLLHRARRLEGNTILYIVLVMVIFGMLGATMVSLFTTSTTSSATLNEDRRAWYLHESAIRYAMGQLRGSDFDTDTIDTLQDTIYTMPQLGSFDFNIFGPWYEPDGSQTLTGGNSLNLKVPRGELPEEYFVDLKLAEQPLLSVINFNFPDPRPDPAVAGASAQVTGFSPISPTAFQLNLEDDFVVSANESVVLAVKPKGETTLYASPNQSSSIVVEGSALKIFPRYDGVIAVHRRIYTYTALGPAGSDASFTGVRALEDYAEEGNLVVNTDDYIMLSPLNYMIVAKANTEHVTYTGDVRSAAFIFDHLLVQPDQYKPDITMPELADNLTEKESDSSFVVSDTTAGQEKITIGGGAADRFGGAWYDADKSVGGITNYCTAGECQFRLGIRVFFTFTKTGSGNGFIFALLNGRENSTGSIGGDLEAVELLGYAGDSRLVAAPFSGGDYLDGQGKGLAAPKIGLEFDTIVNFDAAFEQNQTWCSGGSLAANTRNDPLSNNKDAMQYVFWGSDDPLPIPCRNNKASYDDNRHNPAAADGSLLWANSPNGSPSIGRPAIGSNGNVYVSNRSGFPLYVNAFSPDGTRLWQFNVLDQPIFNPGVDPNSGTIYSDIQGNAIVAINPNGTAKWSSPLFVGADIPSSFVVDSDGTVYFGGNQVPSVPPLPPTIPPGTSGAVYAVTDGGSSGTIKWQFPVQGKAVTTPVLSPDESIVYAAGGYDYELFYGTFRKDNQLYAIDAATGAGAVIYVASDAIAGGPAVDPGDGTIYFGCEDNRVYAINPNGTLKWVTQPTGGDVRTAPAVDPISGTVYAGSRDSFLYAFDRATGGLKWSFDTGAPVDSSPIIGANGTIYFGSDDGNLYAIDASGNERWRFGTGAPVKSSPAIGADGIVYIGSDSGQVYAFSPFAEPRNYRQNEASVENKLVAHDAGEASAPYPDPGFLPTDSNNWMMSGPWAVRMELERTTQAGGEGDYVLRAWIHQCENSDCSDILGTFYETTRVKFDPLNLPPQLVQSFSLPAGPLAGSPDNADFQTFLFGFTSAAEAGDDQLITIKDFQLSFIRPNDPVVTADFAPEPPSP